MAAGKRAPAQVGRQEQIVSIRQHFEREIEKLQADVLLLGSMVEKAILDSVDILQRRDLDAARQLVADDRLINEKRLTIEDNCLALIAMQQPMASDLRTLASILEIATELERMGDYGKGIARITIMLADEPLTFSLHDIDAMGRKACDLLRRALDAFNRRDARTARALPAEDDAVDALYVRTQNQLIACIVADPRVADRAMRLLWVAHNLERAADRVTNICERTVFTITGRMIELDVLDSAQSSPG